MVRRCCSNHKVEDGGPVRRQTEDYLEYERQKERLVDFTLSEYNEKGKMRSDILQSSRSGT